MKKFLYWLWNTPKGTATLLIIVVGVFYFCGMIEFTVAWMVGVLAAALLTFAFYQNYE